MTLDWFPCCRPYRLVTCKIFEELAKQNEICRCTCPTGVGASHLPQGWTFHSVFKTWTPSLSAGTAIDEIFKSLGGNQLKLVVVDEVSMLSAQFLVLLDTRLWSMYKHDQSFGSISVLLIGDFIQLPVTTGRDLWSVMYGTQWQWWNSTCAISTILCEGVDNQYSIIWVYNTYTVIGR